MSRVHETTELHHPTVAEEVWREWLNKKEIGLLVTKCCNAQHIVPPWALKDYGLTVTERRCGSCGALVVTTSKGEAGAPNPPEKPDSSSLASIEQEAQKYVRQKFEETGLVHEATIKELAAFHLHMASKSPALVSQRVLTDEFDEFDLQTMLTACQQASSEEFHRETGAEMLIWLRDNGYLGQPSQQELIRAGDAKTIDMVNDFRWAHEHAMELATATHGPQPEGHDDDDEPDTPWHCFYNGAMTMFNDVRAKQSSPSQPSAPSVDQMVNEVAMYFASLPLRIDITEQGKAELKARLSSLVSRTEKQ